MPTIGPMSELHKIDKYHDHKKLKPDVVRSIITQLLVILTELSSVNFSHGTPSIHAIIFTKDPISYKYDNVHVEGPLTVQITDMWNSSATFLVNSSSVQSNPQLL
jgi:hypothetical protein